MRNGARTASVADAGWWTPEVSGDSVPDADLLYPATPAGPGSDAAAVYSAASESASEAHGPYADRSLPEADSAAAQSRGPLAAASCGSAGYTGLSLAFVGLLGVVAWAWRHGLRSGRCGKP